MNDTTRNYEDQTLIDRREAALVADVSQRTISRWASTGRLTAYKGGEHGRWTRYKRGEVLRVADGLNEPYSAAQSRTGMTFESGI